MLRTVRVANESITSRAVTSTITPRERSFPTLSISSFCKRIKSASERADWIEAIRKSPCLRIGTSIARSAAAPVRVAHDPVAQKSFRLFNAALQIAHGLHLRQIHANRHQRLGRLRGQAGNDDGGPHQPRRF